MRRETRNGYTIRVWSMSIMGWRWTVTGYGVDDVVDDAGTCSTERAAIRKARSVADARASAKT